MAQGQTATDLAQLDADFRRRATTIEALPTRFYLNLTERCSLQCRHCIARSPARTADRSARDMGDDVVEALRPHLAHAAYVGFVHSGEPLLAPALSPLLAALRAERGAEPTVVHLLTNGLALTPERFVQLSQAGVNSWSFSVDGMTSQSHDALRIGSRVDVLLETIRIIAALRTTLSGAVRVGIAWTVTRANLDQIDALLRFAASAGLDWVKLEELYPIDDVARAWQIDDDALQTAATNALAAAAALGVRLLDHTRDRLVRRCQLANDAELRRFSSGDDWVNRMQISPCRMPWELVCVEPDGAVKPMSFAHSVAGNLLSEDLRTIWNRQLFVDERRRSIRHCLRAGATPTCPADPGPAHW